MGLFSKFGKNKQQSPEDSGYYRAADDRALTEKARSKRASSNNEAAGASRGRGRKDGADPVLPEKKRARRRLVGAVALALAVAIGLPMVLDSEPKPLANDIAIQIPSKDKPSDADAPAAGTSRKPAQADALDQSEEIVEPADDAPVPAPPPPARVAQADTVVTPAAPAHVEPKPEPKPERVAERKPEPRPEPKPERVAEHKPEPKPEPRHEPKPEPRPEPKKVAEAKPEPKKAEPKPEPKEPKPETRHAEAKPADAARAIAILEDKPAQASADSGRFVIQVAALAGKDKVDELQGRLRGAGIRSFTQKSPSGDLTRVKVGPFGSRDEAEKARARLQKMGLSGSLTAL